MSAVLDPRAVTRLFSRILLTVVALLLGLIAPLHASGPSPSVADDQPTIQLPAVAPPPVVQVFLVAYRGQGPPEACGTESHIIAAMEGQSGSTRLFFVVVSRGDPQWRELNFCLFRSCFSRLPRRPCTFVETYVPGAFYQRP